MQTELAGVFLLAAVALLFILHTHAGKVWHFSVETAITFRGQIQK